MTKFKYWNNHFILCTITAFKSLASAKDWFSSVSSLFGNVVISAKLAEAYSGRALFTRSRIHLIILNVITALDLHTWNLILLNVEHQFTWISLLRWFTKINDQWGKNLFSKATKFRNCFTQKPQKLMSTNIYETTEL